MAVDVQVLFPQASVPLTSVTLVQGSSPPTLNVIGSDFRAVDEVLVNDREAPTYVVVSPTRLLVRLPDGLSVGDVSTVAVTSRQLTLTPESLLKFRISRTPAKSTGILRLVQLFVKLLFTTPGTDVFSKALGGGGLRALGGQFGSKEAGALVSDFVVAVDAVQRQIFSIQGRQPGLPPEERLLRARVSSAKFSDADAALLVSVELTSQTGRAALANVVV